MTHEECKAAILAREAVRDAAHPSTEHELRQQLADVSNERDELKYDLTTFKGGISALGEACKKLTFCARTVTDGPDKALMAACDEAENALSLAGVSRAIDYIEGLRTKLNSSEVERKKYFDATMRACRISADYMALLREASKWIKQNSFGGSDAVDLWERIDTALAQSAPANSIKYDEVLIPFLGMMRRELHANSAKGDREGWLSMSAAKCFSEINYHVEKLGAAIRDGGGDAIGEHAADVANLSMMLADICGSLALFAQSAPATGEQGAGS